MDEQMDVNTETESVLSAQLSTYYTLCLKKDPPQHYQLQLDIHWYTAASLWDTV